MQKSLFKEKYTWTISQACYQKVATFLSDIPSTAGKSLCLCRHYISSMPSYQYKPESVLHKNQL